MSVEPATQAPDPLDDALKTLVPIADLAPALQTQLVDQAEITDFAPGEYVFREGQTDDYAFYLLKGELEMQSQGSAATRVKGGSDEARYALSQLQPRRYSARARTVITILSFDRHLLEELLEKNVQRRGGGDVEAHEIDAEDDGDWMTRLLQSELFARLPASNIQRIFASFESVPLDEGDVVVPQGSPGIHYYIIQKGCCRVTHLPGPGAPELKLAQWEEGHGFGAEALISGMPWKGSVTMASAGELLRLTKEHFVELIQKPVLETVDYEQALGLVKNGARWLDVRFPNEHEADGIEGSVNVPANTLRTRAHSLDRERPFVLYCDDGRRSAVSTFVLAQRGFDVYCLSRGLNAQRPAMESANANPEDTIAIDIRASAFQAELARAKVQLEQAQRLKQEAEAASARAQSGLSGKAQELEEQSRRNAAELAEIQRLKESSEARLGEERARLETETEETRQRLKQALELKNQAEAARREAETAAQKKLEEERRRAREEAERAKQALEETQRLRAELLSAQHAARTGAESEQQKEQTERKRLAELKEELEREFAAKQSNLDAEYSRNIAELERLQALKAEAEARLSAERKALEQEAVLITKRQQEVAEFKAQAESAKQAAEQAGQQALEAERERLEAQTAEAEQALREAERLKNETEAALASAQSEAEQRHHQREERIQRLQEEAEKRLADKEENLRTETAQNAEELARISASKKQAEARLKAEREAREAESAQSRQQLEAAEREKRRAEELAKQKDLERIEREQRLRTYLEKKLADEQQRLRKEVSRNAEALAVAQREKASAEAAREAAAEEAERIAAEYQSERGKIRQEERAQLQEQRLELEARAKHISAAVEQARRVKQQALDARKAAREELEALQVKRQESDAATESQQRVLSRIEDARARAEQANQKAVAAERARQRAEEAQRSNEAGLRQQSRDEADLNHLVANEAETWIDEQRELETSPEMLALEQRREEHMKRIKLKAEEAKIRTEKTTSALFDDIAAQFDPSPRFGENCGLANRHLAYVSRSGSG